MTTEDTTRGQNYGYNYVVKNSLTGKILPNPFATSPSEPTTHTTAMRLWSMVKDQPQTDYYIEEVAK